jgi:hypothetical protein
LLKGLEKNAGAVKSSPIFALQLIYDTAAIGLGFLTRWVGSIGLAVSVGIV